MDWIELRIITSQAGVEVLANLLNEIGTGGIIIEDQGQSRIPPTLSKGEIILKGYLYNTPSISGRLSTLREEVGRFKLLNPDIPTDLIIREVTKEEWANYWRALFKVEKVGQRVVVKPTWEDYTAQPGEIVVELDPGAFGTGGHTTTASCIRLLEQYVEPGMAVIDVGTGSGILGLIAAKLGASQVEALDYHSDAVKAAFANVQANGLEKVVQVKESDLLAEATLVADLIVSNIVADVIIILVPQLARHLKGQGIYICSGIISDRRDEVLDCLRQNSFQVLEVLEQRGWVTILSTAL